MSAQVIHAEDLHRKTFTQLAKRQVRRLNESLSNACFEAVRFGMEPTDAEGRALIVAKTPFKDRFAAPGRLTEALMLIFDRLRTAGIDVPLTPPVEALLKNADTAKKARDILMGKIAKKHLRVVANDGGFS